MGFVELTDFSAAVAFLDRVGCGSPKGHMHSLQMSSTVRLSLIFTYAQSVDITEVLSRGLTLLKYSPDTVLCDFDLFWTACLPRLMNFNTLLFLKYGNVSN